MVRRCACRDMVRSIRNVVPGATTRLLQARNVSYLVAAYLYSVRQLLPSRLILIMTSRKVLCSRGIGWMGVACVRVGLRALFNSATPFYSRM